jgi:hypothetical protein
LSLPDITSAKFAGSEIAFYKDPLAASYVVTLNASASDAVVAFGASVTTSSYSLSAGKTFVRFVANNNKWFETGGGSGGGVSPTDALTVASLTTTSTGASISGTYPTTSYTLNVNGPMLAVSFNASSDRRLKTNIQSLTSQWDVIQAIEPVSFAWKSNGKQEYGFIAQQVYNVLPEMRPNMVGKHPLSNPDEPLDMSGNPLFYGLDYSRMTPFLWQGMRELMNRVQELEETVRQLQNERSPL